MHGSHSSSPVLIKKARIEIIPLIDIIFFLLATFVMVSLSMVKNRAIPVNLPAASTGAPQERKDFAAITITAKGEVYFDKQPVNGAQLDTALQALIAANPDARVFISGDAKAEFGQAVDVLDHARRLGITKISIETQLKPAP
jgi:biopolymer transport protein ExbD